SNIQTINPIQIMPNKVEKTRKLAVMKKANEIARNYDSSISQVIIRLKDEEQNVLIANSEGTFAEDQRVYSSMAICLLRRMARICRLDTMDQGHIKGLNLLKIWISNTMQKNQHVYRKRCYLQIRPRVGNSLSLSISNLVDLFFSMRAVTDL